MKIGERRACLMESPERKELIEQMVVGGKSFWKVVHAPYFAHDLTNDDVRYVIDVGLRETRGNYRLVAQLFNIKGRRGYKHLLSFLRKRGIQLPFMPYRNMKKAA